MPAIERRVVEVVDRLLLERGELDPVDCLVGFGLLRQTEADARCCSGAEITSALLAPVGEAVALLEQAHTYAAAQNLVAVPRAPAALQQVRALRHDDPSRRLIELCCSILRHSEDGRRQADLFHDSAQTAVLNELKEALAEHRAEAARSALQRLTDVTPDLQIIDNYTRLFPGARICAYAAGRALPRTRADGHAVGLAMSRAAGPRLYIAAVERTRSGPARDSLHARHATRARELRPWAGATMERRGNER
jgi:hypothetical protein